jgi:HEAT repeat protein
MEDFGARDKMTDEFCHSKVAECDLFVGIVGHYFGSCPKGSDKSYTQQEYDAALGLSELGHTDDAVRILLALAQDKKLDELVRCDAAFALGKLEKKSPQAAEALLELANDEDAEIRDDAYCALKEVLGVG